MKDCIQLTLPASFKYLGVLGACIGEMLEQADWLIQRERLAYIVKLAAHEIYTNIIGHAYEGQTDGQVHITLTLSDSPPRLSIDTHDTGRAFDPETVPMPDLDRVQEGGYGLYLARAFLDEVVYRAEPDGNRWHLVKDL